MSGFTVDSSATLPWIVKGPGEELDYWFDWSSWLQQGETLTGASWVISPTEPGGVAVAAGALSSPNKTVVWLNGGLEGKEYTVTVSVTTSYNRNPERSFLVRVRTR